MSIYGNLLIVGYDLTDIIFCVIVGVLHIHIVLEFHKCLS